VKIVNCAFFGFDTGINNANQNITIEDSWILHCRRGLVDSGGTTVLKNSGFVGCETAVVSNLPRNIALEEYLARKRLK